MTIRIVTFGFLVLATGGSVVLDRIAVTVGNDVITVSDIEQEIRVTAFLNGEALDLSAASKRQAAERLVDQDLVRRDMLLSNWPQPEASEAGKMLADIKRERFKTEAQYRQALARYGIDETELKQHLLWEIAALRYTDYRFSSAAPPTNKEVRQHLEAQSQTRSAVNAQHARTGKEGQIRLGQAKEPQPRTDEDSDLQVHLPPPENPPAAQAVPPNVDQQMDAWLKEARSRTRIVYREGAF